MRCLVRIAATFALSVPPAVTGCLAPPGDASVAEPVERTQEAASAPGRATPSTCPAPSYTAPTSTAPTYPAPTYAAPTYSPPIYIGPIYVQIGIPEGPPPLGPDGSAGR